MKVLRIHAKDTLPIRHQMLREGRPVSDCVFDGDEEEQTFHLGAFDEKKLVSVASFYFDKHPQLDEPYQYRLRGMATLPDYQNKGMSSALLKTAFPIIKQNLCGLVWCNARQSALGFYEKVGFKAIGDPFDIATVGVHSLMMKELD